MCRVNSCIYCAPILAWETGAAIALAAPDQFVTLTLTPSTWSDTHQGLESMRQRMQRRGFRYEWAYTREVTRGGLCHVHMWVHGERVPSALEWDFESSESGFGRSHVRSVTKSRSLYYGQKMLIGAADQSVRDAQASIDGFLELNHGRLVHASAGFWRDARGHRLGTRKLAVKIALGRELQQPQWVITAVEHLTETQARLRRGL